MDAKEIYSCDGIIKGSKYLLYIMEDGTLELKWCYENHVIDKLNSQIEDCGYGTRLYYGKANNSRLRSSIPFRDSKGILFKDWEKIM
jgi:hypothetical protein